MGQKVNPHGLRVGIIRDWDSEWYDESDFRDNLVSDQNIWKIGIIDWDSRILRKQRNQMVNERIKFFDFSVRQFIRRIQNVKKKLILRLA